jgi:hypothetical protein
MWGAEAAEVGEVSTQSARGATHYVEYQLEAAAPQVELGWFVLGSMRVERDFQYAKRHLLPYTARPFQVAEESLLVAGVTRLPPEHRDRHLQALRAGNTTELRARLFPTIAPLKSPADSAARISRPSLDGRNSLALELRVDTREVLMRLARGTVSLRSRSGSPVRFTVRVLTDAAPLTPLQRNEIFNRAFLDFLAGARNARDSAGTIRYRRLERQVRGVELLSSKEKLMAGLPNFATYFGRDMMMTALMMRPIWSSGMSEHVIASVLRKLGPKGDVSHEEALGGQAIRENAVVYDSLIAGYLGAAQGGQKQQADSLLEQARVLLGGLQETRENYHMIDDEFQLPVLVARYLADPGVTPERKWAFLFEDSDRRGPRIGLLLREMALVATWTRPYVENPAAVKMVSFPKRDSIHWRSASWRDSDAGYAGGRFAMDVNAIWAPHALESIAIVLARLQELGVTSETLLSLAPDIEGTPLSTYLRDPAKLRHAVKVWKGARRHFEVRLGPAEVQRRLQAKLASLGTVERSYWRKAMRGGGPIRDTLSFLALSLDSDGIPLPIVNTDPATGLFLGGTPEQEARRDIAAFTQRYPIGLFVDRLGPVVANDVYATREVWERFKRDAYHSPRVVWGREVNLLFLGLASLTDSSNSGRADSSSGSLKDVASKALAQTLGAVQASGLGHNELWSYQIMKGRLLPVRYGTSSDVQLWNTTDLAVEFVLSRLPAR